MLRIHPNARTTPLARAEIARSFEPTSVLARGYNQAYNIRCQRVLNGLSPDEVVRKRLKAKPHLAGIVPLCVANG